MKLYLSSFGVGENATALRDLVGDGRRAGVVFNARDAGGGDRLRHRDAEYTALKGLGFACEELDLRQYFDDQDRLRSRLAELDLVWVVGGNTFVLARAMTQSGFGEAIDDALVGERIVYAGYSAGACITGPDLDGCHLIDQQDAVAEGYSSQIEPRALGWIPWRIVPHWRSEHEESPLAELAVAYLLESGLPFQTLRDGQVFIVDTSSYRFA